MRWRRRRYYERCRYSTRTRETLRRITRQATKNYRFTRGTQVRRKVAGSLYRDPFAQLLIFGLIYLAHASAGDVTDNAKSPCQYLRYRKLLVPGRGLRNEITQRHRGELRREK